MIYTGYIPLANILKSNPKRSFSSVASQSSFASSRQASASDLLPSPAALATRAQGEGSPPRAAAAPSQRRPLLHHRYQSSRLARHLVASPLLLPAPPRLGTPGRSVVGPGTPLPASSLAAATPAGISTPLHHQRARIFLAHVIWWRVPPLVQLNLEQVVQHQRVIRQRSQPRRTTCPPQRSSSSRLRAISSRPEPVR